MNDRLREIAIQAQVEHCVSHVRLQEFAELIVKDCLRIVEGYCETSPEIYGLPLDIVEHFDMEINLDE